MIIKKLEVGPIMANCYILGCDRTGKAAVIDPGDEADRILMALSESKLTVEYLINTHGHFDHVGANARLKEATGAKLMIHRDDAPMLTDLTSAAATFGLRAENSPAPDGFLADGDKISFGDITLTVIHTPGHSKGGVSLHTEGVVFSGDTLFAGSIGRTDLPGGNYDTLIESIKNRLLCLDKKTIVYPGHGPETSILQEERMNPFLR